jgi:hypothetical protein
MARGAVGGVGCSQARDHEMVGGVGGMVGGVGGMVGGVGGMGGEMVGGVSQRPETLLGLITQRAKPLGHHGQKTSLLDAQNLGSMNPKQSLRSLSVGW